ncbi:MAG TPA: hypothetical protein VMQ52_00115 [Candidatus Saccharimonadales bacterium]|jgi:hypothetical protein|nr:hypothetical protein [Candidatus Saccharimonadales bacterium]
MPPHTGLPAVGSDNNDWGTILNYFLDQAHDPNTGYLLTTPTNPNNLTDGINYNLATSGSSARAGLVKLAGDLAGTYDSPALASIITSGSVGSSTSVPVLTYDAKGRITAVSSATVAGGGTVSSFRIDGGNSATTYTGTLGIDFGGSV